MARGSHETNTAPFVFKAAARRWYYESRSVCHTLWAMRYCVCYICSPPMRKSHSPFLIDMLTVTPAALALIDLLSATPGVTQESTRLLVAVFDSRFTLQDGRISLARLLQHLVFFLHMFGPLQARAPSFFASPFSKEEGNCQLTPM